MTTQTAPVGTAIAFGAITPVLRVRDAAASTDYFVKALGFKVNFQTPGFVSISRGRCGIFLCEGDQGNPGSWVWIDGKDVEAVFEEFKASGAKIRHPPANYPWALEMQVEDLDGNVLRIGSDPRKDQPAEEWLDMRGVQWKPTPEGGWKRVD